jgi:hypothetical protein
MTARASDRSMPGTSPPTAQRPAVNDHNAYSGDSAATDEATLPPAAPTACAAPPGCTVLPPSVLAVQVAVTDLAARVRPVAPVTGIVERTPEAGEQVRLLLVTLCNDRKLPMSAQEPP